MSIFKKVITLVILSQLMSCTTLDLSGNWLLDSPDDHSVQLDITNLGNGTYYVHSEGQVFSGTYRYEKPFLILVSAVQPRITGYKWRQVQSDKFVLVDEPPIYVSTHRYKPAVLTKNTR